MRRSFHWLRSSSGVFIGAALTSLSLLACTEPPVEPPADVQAEAEAPPAPARLPVPEGEDPAFHAMMDVLTSPRCVNCHPNDGVPKQTQSGRPHLFGVRGGPEGHGLDALSCGACHQDENNADSGVPGAPGWALAPASMAWEGLDRYEIARSMMDPERNGGRSPQDVLHHLTEHPLVLWAWEPGIDAQGLERQPPPVPLEAYRAAVHRWFEGGAQIPGDPPRALATPEATEITEEAHP